MLTVSCSCRQGRGRCGDIQILPDLSVERLEANSFPLEVWGLTRDASGLVARYHFQSQDCLCTCEPVLVGQGLDNWRVFLNGKPVSSVGNRCFIGGMVQTGENNIEIRGSGERIPLSLSGEFGVWPSADGSSWCTGKGQALGLGSLVSQGLPFYSGAVSYHRQFEFPEKVGRRVLRLSGWAGSACSLWVNYSKVADITTQDFKMDIGPYLLAGPNDVEVRICAWPADGDAAPRDFGLSKAFTLK